MLWKICEGTPVRSPKPLTHKVSLAKFARLVKILDSCIRTDEPTAIIQVTSARGFSGLRVQGTTQQVSWSVDLFGGNFYLIKVNGFQPVKSSIPLHVINILKAKLR